MNSSLVATGVILMLAGVFFTFVTLGFGIICTWPMILIGLIIFLVGAVAPSDALTIIREKTIAKEDSEKSRYCPDCGRSIPFDAKSCPYCSKNFFEIEYTTRKTKHCPECGTKVVGSPKFCGYCGTKLK